MCLMEKGKNELFDPLDWNEFEKQTKLRKISVDYVIIFLMKHLEDALKVEASEESRSVLGQSRVKSMSRLEKWSLDPDFIEEGPQGGKEKFSHIAEDILSKKFKNEKYLEEQTFRQLLLQLTSYLSYLPSEIQRLIRIEETLQELATAFHGDLKNYIKHFQSLLDAKVRKLKKKEKRAELLEFERIIGKQGLMKKNNPVSYINQDDKPAKIKIKHNKQESPFETTCKKSFGTMNSAHSNENESGSGKNKSGSDSKSGEANALAVLLANVGRIQDKKHDKIRESQRQSYDFSSVLSASIAVRQRSPQPNMNEMSMIHLQKQQKPDPEPESQGGKDQAFIFHRPKPSKRGKY